MFVDNANNYSMNIEVNNDVINDNSILVESNSYTFLQINIVG